MKTSTAVLLTAAVFGGGQAAFWVWHSSQDTPAPAADNTPPTPALAPTKPQQQPRTIVSTAPQGTTLTENLAVRSTNHPASSLYPKPSDYLNGTAVTNAPADPDAPMSRAELERRAQAVQQETQQRLETLTRDLNLTEDQQDYLFGVIAQSSPSYVPALNVGYYSGGTAAGGGGVNQFTPIVSGNSNRGTGSSSGSNTNAAANTTNAASSPTTASTRTVNDQIYEVLAEDQQDLLEEEIIDRQRWWEDIIDELEDEHDEIVSQTPIVTDPGTAPDPDQEITTGEDGETVEETHGGGNLFDNL